VESVAHRSSAGREAGCTARFANDSPSKPELAWLTAHVAQVEAAEAAEATEAAEAEEAEAAEAAETIVEDSYKRVVEPAPSPTRSLRLSASAPLPPAAPPSVPLRGKKLSLTLQRAASSREHGRMSRGGHPPHPWHWVAPTPLCRIQRAAGSWLVSLAPGGCLTRAAATAPRRRLTAATPRRATGLASQSARRKGTAGTSCRVSSRARPPPPPACVQATCSSRLQGTRSPTVMTSRTTYPHATRARPCCWDCGAPCRRGWRRCSARPP
jgi:hypothetical protein